MPVVQTSSPSVLIERRGRAARAVINRPPLNIMDIATLTALRNAFDELDHDAEVRLIEFAGGGEKAFSAGTDVRDHTSERTPEMLREFHALIRSLLAARCTTLAVVRGHCLGGGMELALACDFILASTSARFAQPEIKVGAFPPVAAVLLPRLIPEKKAMEMILPGEAISAEEALRWGLINRVVTDESLEVEVRKFSDALLAQSNQIMPMARRAVGLGTRTAIEGALRETERIYLEELMRTEDAREGVQAFVEKRPPRWRT